LFVVSDFELLVYHCGSPVLSDSVVAEWCLTMFSC